jgi:4a-hydroxytetrahydrobiopterin dehydratase
LFYKGIYCMKILITEKQNKMIKNKNDWEKVNNKLIKTFYFEDYKGVMSFVKEVMKIADKQDHHPDMTVHYNNVKLSITDHEKGGVSEKCHKFAKAVGDIINKIDYNIHLT